jgi:hypothetical protein
VFDHFANACKKGDQIAWDVDHHGEIALLHSFHQTKQLWKQAQDTLDYIDIHCWRFTPESFKLVLSDLRGLDLIKLNIEAEFDTAGCEFHVTLSPKYKQCSLNRIQLIK